MVKHTGKLVGLANRLRKSEVIKGALREHVAVANRQSWCFATLFAPEEFRNVLKQGFAFSSEKPLEQSQTAVPIVRV